MRSMLSLTGIAALLLAAVLAQGARAAVDVEPGPACPNDAREMHGPVACICPPPSIAGAMVWGTDVYSDDSNVCAAAVHAGIIGLGGGAVRVLPREGIEAYRGTTRNGVTTLDYGRWDRAFTLERGVSKASYDPNQCPVDFQALRGREGVIVCNCSAAQTLEGAVWGTDVYTDDSSICLAAVHAGAIGRSGGRVRVLATRGRASYPGSTRNGVASQAYGRWPNAFSFAQ
jgi:hypothetical protein